MGTATWIVSPSYRGKVDGVSGAGHANADHGVIVITRSVSGDSGGPLIYSATASGHDMPTIAAVLSKTDADPVFEGRECTNNDPPEDDAFASRISWDVIRFIAAQTGIACRALSSASKQYVRCFDLPFIEDVESEGMQRDLAVAIAVSSID